MASPSHNEAARGSLTAKAVRLLSLAVLLLFLAASFSSASASPLSERKAEMQSALERLRALQERLDEYAAAYGRAEARTAEIEEEIARLEEDEARSRQDLESARQLLEKRLVSLYKNRGSNFVLVAEAILTSRDLSEAVAQIELLRRIAGQDRSLFGDIQRHLVKVDERQRELDRKRAEQTERMEELKKAQAELEESIRAAAEEYKALKKQVAALEEQERKEREAARLRAALAGGSLRAIEGFVFPVAGPHSFADTWGAPRSGGRRHQGTDIFAARGTPCVACYDGVVSQTYWNQGLGGTGIWLVGDNGVSYYYCHLDGIAPGIAPGVRVKAGQVIGYVGDSGNARGGPCHLHFQVHPGGGAPINPYPILRAADG